MICQCCKRDFAKMRVEEPQYDVLGNIVCHWCLWMLKGFIESVIQGNNLKIQWGNRSLYKGHWVELKRFLKEYEPTTIIEYGSGLSTELLVLEGFDVWSFEPSEWYAEMCRRTHKNITAYDPKEGPPLIDKRFDFALVDATQTHRFKEMAHAVAHTDGYIYMHDPEPVQVEILERHGWLPMEQWSVWKEWHRFYEAPP